MPKEAAPGNTPEAPPAPMSFVEAAPLAPIDPEQELAAVKAELSVVKAELASMKRMMRDSTTQMEDRA